MLRLTYFHAEDAHFHAQKRPNSAHKSDRWCVLRVSLLFQVKAIKEGKSISKPIYNHVNGTLDENENIEPTPIVIFEGLHPFHDKRVDDLMDFKIYVDITPEVKFNWKVQRDHEERGHSIER